MALIQHRVFEGKQAGPHLLITGGVHGDEYEPMAAIRRLIRLAPSLSLRGRLTLAPVVNEAAFLRGTRAAEDGLDLARTCPGRADGSVTERIAFALSTMIRSADYYIDLHTGGAALTVFPLAGYVLHSSGQVLEAQRRMARAFNLPLVWGTDPSLPGRSLSVARDAGIPAIYAEYMGGGRCEDDGVNTYVDGCLNVMAALTMLDRAAPASQVRFVLEDREVNSGHMQICHPAPADGFFEPCVALGSKVQAGQPLGEISDPLGENMHLVRADRTGMVIVLRTQRLVRLNDSLAVIAAVEC